MDKEFILRLGLYLIPNINLDESDELYNPNTNNHITKLKLFKDDHMYDKPVKTSLKRGGKRNFTRRFLSSHCHQIITDYERLDTIYICSVNSRVNISSF